MSAGPHHDEDGLFGIWWLRNASNSTTRRRVRIRDGYHGGNATTSAGRQAFAANRQAGCYGMQAAESKLRNAWRSETTAQLTADKQTIGQLNIAARTGWCSLAR